MRRVPEPVAAVPAPVGRLPIGPVPRPRGPYVRLAKPVFDRLIAAVDAWAAENPERRGFAQIGRGGTPPCHLDWAEDLEGIYTLDITYSVVAN